MLHTIFPVICAYISRIMLLRIRFPSNLQLERSAKIWWIGESFKPQRVISMDYFIFRYSTIPPVPPM